MKKRNHRRALIGRAIDHRIAKSAARNAGATASPPSQSATGGDAGPISVKSYRADGWTYEIREEFLAAFEDCLNITKSCEKVGRSRRSFYALRKRDAEFAEAFDDALDQGYLMLETTLLERAMFGTEREILDRENKVVTLKSHDNRLAAQLLRMRKHALERAEDRAERAAAEAREYAQAEAAAAYEAENQWSPSQIAEQSRLMDSIRSRLEDLKAGRLAKEAEGG
jgi:hypothetical protein